MRQLQFVGVSEDGANLVLRDPGDAGATFQVPIDDRLRAASRGDRTRLGQIELEQTSTLRPREIQARIRAGETPEEVAEAGNAPLQRVMRFAYPVLQERQQVTIEARRTRIRRSDAAPRLGEQVEERLIRQGVDPETAQWDAYRRDDGTWWVTLRWDAGALERRAQWSFDLPGHTITPGDDVAAELQAEGRPHGRPIAAVPFVPADEPDEERPEPRPAPVRRRPVAAERRAPVAERKAPVAAERRRPSPPPEEATPGPLPVAAVPEPAVETEPPVPTAPKRGRSGRSGRPKVPPWEDIVFGTRGRR